MQIGNGRPICILLSSGQMQIKLNVFNNGSCAQVYAFCDPDEEAWLNFRIVKIWHNSTKTSMVGLYAAPDNYDNDYCVSFVSKMSFNSFCSQFELSEYNRPENYQYLTHNCSNAAHYALQLAGVTIPANSLRWMSFSSYVSVPGPFLTPIELFNRAKKYKTTLLEYPTQPFSRISFRFELASSRLHFWARTADAENRDKIHTLLSEMNQRIKKRPWHAEIHLETLVNITDWLMHEASESEATDYEQLASTFRERNNFVETQFLDTAIFALILLKFLMLLHHGLLHYETNWQFAQSFLKNALVGSQNDWLMLIPFFLLVIATGAYDILYPPRSSETVLSRVISNLTAGANQQSLIQNTQRIRFLATSENRRNETTAQSDDLPSDLTLSKYR